MEPLATSRLVGPAYVASSLTTAYTVTSGTTAILTSILLHNGNTTAEMVTINFVPNGVSASAQNEFFKILIVAGEEVLLEFARPLVLTAGYTLQASTTTASKVSITVNGNEDATQDYSLLSAPTYVTNANVDIFTSGTNGKQITNILVHSTDISATQNLSVWLIPSGGSAELSNLITTPGVQAGETIFFEFPEGLVLNNGDKITMSTTTDNKVSVLITGR